MIRRDEVCPDNAASLFPYVPWLIKSVAPHDERETAARRHRPLLSLISRIVFIRRGRKNEYLSDYSVWLSPLFRLILEITIGVRAPRHRLLKQRRAYAFVIIRKIPGELKLSFSSLRGFEPRDFEADMAACDISKL